MASRSFKKYANLGLDEEKDFFLASLNKRIRNARKKLEQIDDLAKKDKSTLKSEQLEKIKSRPEVLENIKYVDEIKDMYYSAYKTAKEEGKAVSSAADNIPAAQTETQAQPVETQPQAQPQVQEVSHTDALGKVLNLVHFAQFFRDQGHVQQFRQANVESVADFESFYELYVKIFTFSESDKLVRVEDKLNRSLSELESYVNGTQQPALRNQTYGHLQNIVEKVCDSTWFKEHKADVSTRQAKTGAEPSAIGSELKKTHEEAPSSSHQEKHKSPEKEATKVSPVKEAKRDWGTVEDEDDDEGLDKLREEEGQENKFEAEGGRAVEESEKPYTSLRDKQQEEEAKQKGDDEWATVTAKHKEKKEEKPFRGGNKPFRGGDGQRGDRGGQRRPRPEGQEGEKRERKPRVEGEGQEGENRGQRGGFRGGNRGGARGGFQKRDGGDEYKRKEGGDVYQKKSEGANKTTEGQ